MSSKNYYSPREIIDALGFAAIFFSVLIAIQYLTNSFLHQSVEGFLKWVPYISVLILFSLILAVKEYISSRLNFIFTVIFIAILYWMVVKKIIEVMYVQYFPDEISIAIIFLIVCCIVLLAIPMLYRPQRKYLAVNFVLALTSIVVFQAISWISMIDLNNWVNYRLSMVDEFYWMLFASFFVIFFIHIFYEKLELKSNLVKARLPASRLGLDIVAVSLFLFLSFRYDSLFQLDSSYNWEYFVGVMRTIRAGGILLFNIPSQYGFLNLILANEFSPSSEWQAFYLFQSFLLFIVSTAIYIGYRSLYKFNLVTYLFTTLIICLSLFFADTSLIGPYLFPSSSVVRFFWVYIFLCFAWIRPSFSRAHAWFYAICWPIAFLWSAESAFYSTAIIGFMIIGLIYEKNPLTKSYIQKLIFCVILVLIFVYFSYWIKYGVMPEIFNLFEFALGYASGYGALKMPDNGPLMAPILIFLAILILLQKYSIEQVGEKKFLIPLFISLGCIWSVCSYYIGRPAHQNITAMLPIFITVLYFSSALVKIRGTHCQSMYLRGIAIPLFFLIIIRIFIPGWSNTFYSFKSFSSDIESRLPAANKNYKQLIESLDSNNNRSIAYLGEEVAPPILNNELKWLNHQVWIPLPIYLLYPPTSHTKRLIYLNKYFCAQTSPGGAIVGKLSDQSTNTIEFLNDVGYFFELRSRNTNAEYWSEYYEGFKKELCLK